MTTLTAHHLAGREPVVGRFFERLAARLAGGTGVAWRAMVEAFSVFDWIATAGALMLLVGVWVWFGAGPAFTVVGGIVLVLGIAGGRAAAKAAEPEEPERGRG